MEEFIGVQIVFAVAALQGLGHALVQRLQGGHALGVNAVGTAFCCCAFQHQAHVEHVVKFGHRQLGHHHPGVGHIDQRTFSGQALQRRTHRHDAHAQALGDVVDFEPLPRQHLPYAEPLAQLGVGGVLLGSGGGGFHVGGVVCCSTSLSAASNCSTSAACVCGLISIML